LRTFAGLAAAFGIIGSASAATCHVTPQAVSFGAVDPIGGAAVDGVGSVNVTCDAPVDFAVGLSTGTGTFNDRRMSSGAAQLRYNIYTNPSRSVIWADGITGSSVSGSGADVDLTMYGKIAAGQNAPAGSYVDSVAVTISY
jgi:spore coat protein U-like protein